MDVICPDFSLSLANMDGSIRCTNKSQLNTIHESEEGISCPTLLPTTLPTYTIINGMKLIYSIGKPTGASTFGDSADIVNQSMRSNVSNVCTRVDVVFDRYIEHSIKHGSREYRARGQTSTELANIMDLPENMRSIHVTLSVKSVDSICS